MNWVVTSQEKELFDQIFQTLDTDKDGFIIGTDECVRKIFLKTALVHTTLAHIWNLTDILQNGKLNSEQFALAMHLVNEAKKGIELPVTLTPEMIPPSLRPKSAVQQQDSEKFFEPNKFNNKELEFLAEELKELENEKHNLEHEVTQQETHMKLKESEIKSIKNEIETMLQMIKQLENQKIEASKRLDEMENQIVILRQQSEEQKTRSEIEEAELKFKKEEFEGLKSEEQQYESKVSELKKEVEKISAEIAESQLLVSKYKTKTIDLEEYENHLKEENKEFDICIASRDIHRLNALIAKQLQLPEKINSFKQTDGFNDAEFQSFSNELAADPFAGEDPFANENNGLRQQEDFFANEAFAKSNKDDDDPFVAKNSFNESTPELPPKAAPKKPGPPRPAPPKTGKPQPKIAADPWANTDLSNDPFATSTQQNNSGFANFDDFANFDQAFVSSNNLFTPTKQNTKANNSFDFDPFANFSNSGSDFKFDEFETNWSSKSSSNNQHVFDPFAPQKPSPIYQFLDQDKKTKKKEKEIKNDYELPLKIGQGDLNNGFKGKF